VALFSVKAPTLFSHYYLNRYQKWLKQGRAYEHRELLQRMPWYFLDSNEIIAYQILESKYLCELGNIRKAYEVLSSIEPDLLYPEEQAELTENLVVLLIQLGNFTKAESVIHSIENTAPSAYGFLKSHLSELQGNLDAAWHYAREGENAICARKKDAHTLTELYTQLGRLSFFQNNVTEMFRYYYLALEQAKEYKDVRLLHAPYQNLLNQILIQHKHEKDWSRLMQEYTTAVANSSLNNMIELLNFRIAQVRQRCDRNAEYTEIMSGYRYLHQKTTRPEQYMIEVSTLKMLNNGGYDINEVLDDVKQHFDSYFDLPLPARFIALQDLSCPFTLSPEQAQLYAQWTPKLVEYAQKQAMDDLDEYERGLSSDCVNERCWVILQRIDFTRRSNQQYDSQQVSQWMQELILIYNDHGQLLKVVETETYMLRQFEEIFKMQPLVLDVATLDQLRQAVKDAYAKSMQLPAATVGALLIDLAYFSAQLGETALAQDSLERFRSLKQSPLHFSWELQQKIVLLNQRLPVRK
jgi:hypothetical protein